jgi:cystathionine beta-lyase
MMEFDFDTPVDRRNTASMKWQKYAGKDIIPLWVADMDFHSPPAVIEALHRRVDHGVFGYTLVPEELNAVVVDTLQSRYNWRVSPEWVVWLPGLVTGLNVACRSVGDDHDEVLTAVPVYPPFLKAPGNSRRHLIKVPLAEDHGRWTFDFERLEAAVTPRTRLFMLCNPHNPVGRLFTREELTRLAALCEKHNMIICSDEIHCDLILEPGKRHVPAATLDPAVAQRTITMMAPSKTFNLPGLGCSFAVIPSDDLRQRFLAAKAGIVPMINALGFTAALAAYADCDAWVAALLTYLRQNRDAVAEAVAGMPDLSMAPVEATYLAWIDVRQAGIDQPASFFESAGVGLQEGAEFDGRGFVRLNFGCCRSLLVTALQRMAAAMEKWKATRVRNDE